MDLNRPVICSADGYCLTDIDTSAHTVSKIISFRPQLPVSSSVVDSPILTHLGFPHLFPAPAITVYNSPDVSSIRGIDSTLSHEDCQVRDMKLYGYAWLKE